MPRRLVLATGAIAAVCILPLTVARDGSGSRRRLVVVNVEELDGKEVRLRLAVGKEFVFHRVGEHQIRVPVGQYQAEWISPGKPVLHQTVYVSIDGETRLTVLALAGSPRSGRLGIALQRQGSDRLENRLRHEAISCRSVRPSRRHPHSEGAAGRVRSFLETLPRVPPSPRVSNPGGYAHEPRAVWRDPVGDGRRRRGVAPVAAIHATRVGQEGRQPVCDPLRYSGRAVAIPAHSSSRARRPVRASGIGSKSSARADNWKSSRTANGIRFQITTPGPGSCAAERWEGLQFRKIEIQELPPSEPKPLVIKAFTAADKPLNYKFETVGTITPEGDGWKIVSGRNGTTPLFGVGTSNIQKGTLTFLRQNEKCQSSHECLPGNGLDVREPNSLSPRRPSPSAG